MVAVEDPQDIVLDQYRGERCRQAAGVEGQAGAGLLRGCGGPARVLEHAVGVPQPESLRSV